MDLWQLHIFCKVVELKSFSKAAEAIHLSQPTVSSHIKDLEDHFELRLVDRLARRIEPTRAGKLLYRYARRILALRDEAESAMADFQGTTRGRLTIGGSTIPASYILPPIIGSFSTVYPEVTITLVVGDTMEIINKTLSLEVELAVVGARSKHRRLEQLPLVKDEMRLVVFAGHKWSKRESIDLGQLLAEPLIVREPGSGTLRCFEESITRKGYRLEDFNIIARMGSTQAVCQGIKSGIGVSVLSSLAVDEDVAAGKVSLLKIDDLELGRNFYLTTPRNRTPSPLAAMFIDFLMSKFSPSNSSKPERE